jgi:hypothetical protein
MTTEYRFFPAESGSLLERQQTQFSKLVAIQVFPSQLPKVPVFRMA